jgi:flagellar basal-body rod protein FlgF
MDSGLYAAYTGLLARTQALDTAANNLANVGTTGFRAEHQSFRGQMADALGGLNADASQVGNAVNTYSSIASGHLDLSQGAITKTGNSLDVSLQGQGFFTVQTAHGVRYTRDGSFTRANDGTLKTQTGDTVLDTNGKPIVIPTGPITIGTDGSMSVAAPDGTSAVFAQLQVVNFSGSPITAEGTNLFNAGNAKPVASTADVHQGTLEGANEDAAQLMLLQRQAEMMQKTMTVFDNQFDKTAAEELSRVV